MEKLIRLKDFKALRVSVASPEKILSWSNGEVIKPETINYRTFRPEKDGLFDERIFGPTKDFECYCGKYKRIRYKGIVCDKCGVEVTRKSVRRERMGHLRLSAPVAHAWYFRGIPSKLGLLLDISPRLLESVIYFSRFMVVNVDYAHRAKVIGGLEREISVKVGEVKKQFEEIEKEEKEATKDQVKKLDIKGRDQRKLVEEEIMLKSRKRLTEINEKFMTQVAEVESNYQTLIAKLEKIEEKIILSEEEYYDNSEYLRQFAKVSMGAEAIKEILGKLHLDEMSKQLRGELTGSSGQKRIKIVKRLGVVESLRRGNVKPEWMIITTLPIIPPDLRPMVQLEGGRFATSDLNDLYRAVINRNNRLKRLLDMGAPEIIVRNEKRMLQESVDALIDSSKVQRYRVRRGKLPLKSLTDMLKGKQGRFRQNLLGKRVDYSGRSVIVAGPTLKMYEVGIPKEMALELFKPFIIKELLMGGLAPNPKSAKYFLDTRAQEVWDALEKVVYQYPVLLNRAPTLHRLGIVAFYPRLIEGNAIQLHPCVCAGFNADFDGDQMSVHVPLSAMAKLEAKEIMLASRNLIKPADGDPIAIPNKEMALGTFYLTSINDELPEYPQPLADELDAIKAYNYGALGLRQIAKIRIKGELVETTVGRIFFNQILPESMRFYNIPVEKKGIKKLVNECMRLESEDETVRLIDAIKDIGFYWATQSGVSVSIFDNVVSPKRDEVIQAAEQKALEINNNYIRGLITKKEKSSLIQGIWSTATHDLDVITWEELDEKNDVKIIVNAGASRATREQVKQLGGMKGLVYDLTGNIAELPIKSNFRRGLSGIEYFTGARAARKSLADTALKTADSGYLTRKLVDVAQEVMVVGKDCGAVDGITVSRKQKVALVTFADRIYGRVAGKDIKIDNKKVVKKGDMISRDVAELIEKSNLEEIEVHSPLTCLNNRGICEKCYGMDLATRAMVDNGIPIGVIAAQSIGEPGTQLTLRTFHTGGIVGKDITQGLPRITELFEARTPKFRSVMSTVAGRVSVKTDGNEVLVTITPTGGKKVEDVVYSIPKAYDLLVNDGDLVGKGSPLTEGYLDPRELMKEVGLRDTQKYIVAEVQNVYTSQGVTVNDKHVEVIVRQMFGKLLVDEVGDSHFFPGDLITTPEWEEEGNRIKSAKGAMPKAHRVILGVTRSALNTESFLAAASFQETSRVLTEAAMSGKVDRLTGLKENVILGRRIPVGDRVNYTEGFAEQEKSEDQ